ncbi:MAG: hypothetical protein L3J02_00470 [Henriciella sp.]|nr:hypothetical protein [Henriciella sp.]
MMDLNILLSGSADSGVIFACALIGALGLGAQWLAWRLQAPAIVLMALAGLAVGPLWAMIFGEPLLNPEKVFNGGGQEFEEKLREIIQAYDYLKSSGFC